MDEIVGKHTDSIIMSLSRSAMDNAHEKVRSIKGPMEFLNETSKFYELAIIQIDATSRLIKEEPEDQIPETGTEKMLADLIELKDLFCTRLNQTIFLITEKDKELMKLGSQTQNLADFEHKFQSFEHEESTEKVMIKQMNSDSDILKATLDLPLGQIKKAKLGPFEKQWRWSIEKEMILIIIKGFIRDLNMKSPIKIPNYAEKDIIIARLMKERQNSNLQTMAMEEHYMILVNECYNEFWCDNIEANVREDVFVYVLQEVTKDWSVYKANQTIQMQLTNEIYKTIFDETINDIKLKVDFEMQKIQNEALVYKKAFARRCDNLILAETEV